VVATDVGDSRRIVGDTGVIVPPGDIAAIVTAITRVRSQSRTEHDARAKAARSRIEDRYSLARMVSTFDALHLHGILPDFNEDDAGTSGCSQN
jgi:glycosyltransferase involved in cell wall biosynthesis